MWSTFPSGSVYRCLLRVYVCCLTNLSTCFIDTLLSSQLTAPGILHSQLELLCTGQTYCQSLGMVLSMSRQSFFSTCAVVMIVATTSLCLYNTGVRESK